MEDSQKQQSLLKEEYDGKLNELKLENEKLRQMVLRFGTRTQIRGTLVQLPPGSSALVWPQFGIEEHMPFLF